MSKIYVAYFDSPGGIVLHDYVGWSESEYLAKSFLNQFTVDKNIYQAHLLELDDTNLASLANTDITINSNTMIDTFTTVVGNQVAITNELYLDWLEEVVDDEGPIRGWFRESWEEKEMYDVLYAICEHRMIQNQYMVDAIKRMTVLMFERYRTVDLDPYVKTIDAVEIMIREGFVKPIYRNGGSSHG